MKQNIRMFLEIKMPRLGLTSLDIDLILTHLHTSATVEAVARSYTNVVATSAMTPRCVANTAPSDHSAQSFFKSAQWSPDGTTLLTNNEDNIIRAYVL